MLLRVLGMSAALLGASAGSLKAEELSSDDPDREAAGPEPGDTDEEKRAVALFEEGKRKFHEGSYSEAANAFRRANALRPNWKLLYNIGQSEAAARRYGLAVEAFQSYLVLGGDEITETRRDEVMEEMEKLRKIVGTVRIDAPPGCTVQIDDTPRGTTPLPGPLLVSAGVDHEVIISKEDAPLYSETVRLNGGETRTVALPGTASQGPPETQPLEGDGAGEAPPAETMDAPRGKALKISGWALFGCGATALVAGAVTGGIALGLDKDLEPYCSDGGCPTDKAADGKRLDNLALTTDILLISGGVIAATGIVLVLVDLVKGKGEKDTLTFAPSATPTFAGLTLVKDL